MADLTGRPGRAAELTISKGEQPKAVIKSSSYRQWQAALTSYGASRKASAQKEYWEVVSGNYKPLPEDKVYSGEVLVKDMQDYEVKLGIDQTRRLLQDVPKVYHTEINDMLLAALGTTLCKWSGKQEVVIGLEGHGREEISQEIKT